MTYRRKHNGRARPIRTKRDFEGASMVAKRLKGEPSRDSAAELRLQSLLREMDKFDDAEDGTDFSVDDSYPGPRRRWSDEASGPE